MWVEFDRREALEMWRSVTLAGVRDDAPDLTARQLAVLMTVYLSEPPHTVRDLAATLSVAKPAITRALDTLSHLGLVKRKRDPADRRSVLVTRTVKGSVFLTDFGERIEAAARKPFEPTPPDGRPANDEDSLDTAPAPASTPQASSPPVGDDVEAGVIEDGGDTSSAAS